MIQPTLSKVFDDLVRRGFVKGCEIKHEGAEDIGHLDRIEWNSKNGEWDIVTEEGKRGSIHFINMLQDIKQS